jgi:Flp pilus assembly CpaF family ATPase
VYLLSDTCTSINDFRFEWPFCEDLLRFRKIVMPGKDLQFWDAETDGLSSTFPLLRILVCGSNGIGKSTLINKVFGIQDSEKFVVSVRYMTCAIQA